MVWIFIGMLLVSSATTYAWWVKIRVARLQQDIFQLRGTLFDRAADLRAFDDLAYIKMRAHLNSIAVVAEWITIPVMFRFLNSGVGNRVIPKSENAELQAVLDDTIEACVVRLRHYLLFETITGLLGWPLLVVNAINEAVAEQTTRWVRRWVISASPIKLMSWAPAGRPPAVSV